MELSVTMHDFCTGARSKSNKYIGFDHNLLDLGKKKKTINMKIVWTVLIEYLPISWNCHAPEVIGKWKKVIHCVMLWYHVTRIGHTRGYCRIEKWNDMRNKNKLYNFTLIWLSIHFRKERVEETRTTKVFINL